MTKGGTIEMYMRESIHNDARLLFACPNELSGSKRNHATRLLRLSINRHCAAKKVETFSAYAGDLTECPITVQSPVIRLA